MREWRCPKCCQPLGMMTEPSKGYRWQRLTLNRRVLTVKAGHQCLVVTCVCGGVRRASGMDIRWVARA